jgi:hypothetical protein
MPPKAPSSAAAATAIVNPQPIVAQVAAQAAAPRPVAVASPQAAYPARRSTLPPAAIGLAPAPAGDDDDDGFDFADLEAGDYILLAYVDQILIWPRGAGVTFKCICSVDKNTGALSRAGVYGRELGWDQSPPEFADPVAKPDNFRRWRRDLVKNYLGLDLPEVAAGDKPGWDENPPGVTVPPYYRFFTDTIGASVVPIVIRLSVHVDAGYEKYPKIRAMKYETSADGSSYILAPKPRKLAPWIAEGLGWEGTADLMVIKKTGAEVPFVKDIVGISPPAGMPTWRDLQ